MTPIEKHFADGKTVTVLELRGRSGISFLVVPWNSKLEDFLECNFFKIDKGNAFRYSIRQKPPEEGKEPSDDDISISGSVNENEQHLPTALMAEVNVLEAKQEGYQMVKRFLEVWQKRNNITEIIIPPEKQIIVA